MESAFVFSSVYLEDFFGPPGLHIIRGVMETGQYLHNPIARQKLSGIRVAEVVVPYVTDRAPAVGELPDIDASRPMTFFYGGQADASTRPGYYLRQALFNNDSCMPAGSLKVANEPNTSAFAKKLQLPSCTDLDLNAVGAPGPAIACLGSYKPSVQVTLLSRQHAHAHMRMLYMCACCPVSTLSITLPRTVHVRSLVQSTRSTCEATLPRPPAFTTPSRKRAAASNPHALGCSYRLLHVTAASRVPTWLAVRLGAPPEVDGPMPCRGSVS